MDSKTVMDILKEEMDSDELCHRVNAIHRINLVAAAIGANEVKETLIPYIKELMEKEEDEVLYAIAGEIIKFHDILGKEKSILIDLLKRLAG